MNDAKTIGGMFGTCLSAVGAGLSVTELQAIVSIIATVIGLLITITTTIIIPVWKKIRDAKKDGVITPEEVEDIVETTKKGIDEISDKTER